MAETWELKSPFAEPEGTQTPSLPVSRRVLTVTELTRQIQALFEETFAYGVWVEGELSDPKVYPSGHLWFDLKDSQSTLKSVMWRDDARRLKFQPEQGLQMICFGQVEFYPPRGEVKFIARSMEPKGLGALQLAFEQLKERLQKEGLFDEARKRPLPVFPERIGIVTSPRGAAIDDMLKLLRGHPQVVLFPSRVQGEDASQAIALGIKVLNSIEDLDLIIVGRGGGSLEDLWPFNEEAVARAIFSSKVPVISAVGHEKDVTISDLVADVRAPTPTKGAELVIAQRRAALERLGAILEDPAFTQPEEWIESLQERVEELSEELSERVRESLSMFAHTVRVLQGDLLARSPQALILHQAERLHGFHRSLESQMKHALDHLAARFLRLGGRLNDLSPLSILERGYSITFNPQGRIVREARLVKVGDLIQTKLHRGRLTSRVESKTES